MTRDASDEPIGIRNAMQKCPWKLSAIDAAECMKNAC